MVRDTMRGAPTVFSAPERRLFIGSRSRVRQLSASGHSFVYVYRASDGSTGFDADPTIRAAVQEMLLSSWIFNNKDDLFHSAAEFPGIVLTIIREGMMNGTVVSHEPSASLLDEFARMREHRTQVKMCEIKRRAGKSCPEPVSPRLSDLVRSLGSADPESLDAIANESRFITLWRHSERGLHFIGLDGIDNADLFVRTFFGTRSISFVELSDVRDLPVW